MSGMEELAGIVARMNADVDDINALVREKQMKIGALQQKADHIFKFCVNSKTDVRFMNSCNGAEPDFPVLPLSVLYKDFRTCQCSFLIPLYRFLPESLSSKYISNWEWIWPRKKSHKSQKAKRKRLVLLEK